MRHRVSSATAVGLALSVATTLHASESEFLHQFSGTWSGGGEVRMSPDQSPITVSCDFAGVTTERTATLEGTCTGMLVISREVGAQITVENGTYVGSYIGSERGPAALEGNRDGSALALTMQWPDHPPADMTLANPGEGVMLLTTIEPHPETGEPVVTAELELERE